MNYMQCKVQNINKYHKPMLNKMISNIHSNALIQIILFYITNNDMRQKQINKISFWLKKMISIFL